MVFTYMPVKTTHISTHLSSHKLHCEQMNALSSTYKLIAVGYFLNVCSLANIGKNNF